MKNDDLDLSKIDDGSFGLPTLDKEIERIQKSLSLPEIPVIDSYQLQEYINKQTESLIKHQKMALKATAAVQIAAAQSKMIEKVLEAHLSIKAADPGNNNLIRIFATSRGIQSWTVSPFWKFVKDEIDVSWDDE